MKEPIEILQLIQDAMFRPPNKREQNLALLEVIRQIQIEAYNTAIDDCDYNVELTSEFDEEDNHEIYYIDRQSILKLKK